MRDVIDGVVFDREPPIGCPQCGKANESRIIAAHYGMFASLAHCDGCRLGYQSPRPSDEASVAYMNWRWSSGDGYVSDTPAKRRSAQKALRLALKANPKPVSLLDFGAGGGTFVREAKEFGIDAVGVERSQSAIDNGRSIGVELVDTIPNRKFEMITMWDVVEHLRDPVSVLSMLKSHLTDNGVLIVETGNYENWYRIAEGDRWNLYLLDHHYYFTPASLERSARDAGFSSFELSDAGKIAPSPRLAYKRPRHFLRSYMEYWKALNRWPQHGAINVMVAFLRQ